MAEQLPALSPCPHCGTPGEFRSDTWGGSPRWWTVCPNKDCEVGHKFFTQEDAAAMWNKRDCAHEPTHKLVPLEPTEEMAYRGGEATAGRIEWDDAPDDAPDQLARAIYRAMLNAAPSGVKGGCEIDGGDPKQCGRSPACGCPDALAAYGVAMPFEARRWCKGDEAWTNWQPCTAEEAERRRKDGSFEVRPRGVKTCEAPKPYGWARTGGPGPEGAPLFLLGESPGRWADFATYIALYTDGVTPTDGGQSNG